MKIRPADILHDRDIDMKKVILDDFRCFSGRYEIALRPLTLLVGENSTGKTSLLAGIRLAVQLRLNNPNLDFNEPPFELGSFEEIATNRKGKSRAASSFSIASEFSLGDEQGRPINSMVKEGRHTVIQENTFIEKNGQPSLYRHRISLPDFVLEIAVTQEGLEYSVTAREGRAKEGEPLIVAQGNVEAEIYRQPRAILTPSRLHFLIMRNLYTASFENSRLDLSWERFLVSIDRASRGAAPFAAAPIRAQPRRTYEPGRDTPQPQGDHVPQLLAQIYGEAEWKSLRDPLMGFARTSGLFRDVSVKRLGKGQGAPFQIMVKLGVERRNLIDVGYGVSQVLPLIVDLLRGPRDRVYLIQQPEVHLHPKAQAELASLFTKIAATQAKQLVVETHSDHLIDRIRTEVRDGGIAADQVIIHYFERVAGEVKIYPLEIDVRGNLQNAPASYRRFFLDEERRFLGF